MALHLQIITPIKKAFEGEVSNLTLPGILGEMGILEQHSPLLSQIESGLVRFRTANAEKVFAVRGGFVEVLNDKVMVLADEALDKLAEGKSEISTQLAEAEQKMVDSEVSLEDREVWSRQKDWLAVKLLLQD